ncbi:hypothetical protein DS745_14700 [Anaerobacillus alkaliphilus]|uniref:Uncharacterized protein n=1 Tax=Anaerobacillus alkaliphilus TaxID=1548597 RepID=A0A4Q0VSA9_9BACI|nr:hypothetical protein [Anaerobacillus alkaliphilus]RXI99469.1 hypothetical protein DS745_14700 [Anaerobacillus alkaliphilus]
MNKFVFFLPVGVMALLFYFGYHYINNIDATTNESLQKDIVVSFEANREGDTVTIIGKWDWTQMPVDGLVGNDYITIAFQDKAGATLLPDNIYSTELNLLKGNQVLQTIEGEVNEKGIVFSFPNEIIDHESYGNRGEVTVVARLDSNEQYMASLSYVHTWLDHELIAFNSLYSLETGLSDILTNKYWVINRLIQF